MKRINMKITKVNYQKVFPISPYVNEKIGFEAEIDDTESPEQTLTTLKEIAEQWHKENNKGLYIEVNQEYAHLVQPPRPSTELPVINKAEERLGILIENAASKEELMSYKNEITTPYLSNMFSNKLAQLRMQNK